MSRIHNVQRVNGKVEPHAIMEFRGGPERYIGVYQDANGIYLHFRGAWHWCENDGSAFLLWGELTKKEKNFITSRVRTMYGKGQVYIETFQGGQACVLCLPENPRMYLECDIVDANGVLQQTRLDPDKEALEIDLLSKMKNRQCHTLIYAKYHKTPKMKSCFFMSDGTFRYKPGDIRPMLD